MSKWVQIYLKLRPMRQQRSRGSKSTKGVSAKQSSIVTIALSSPFQAWCVGFATHCCFFLLAACLSHHIHGLQDSKNSDEFTQLSRCFKLERRFNKFPPEQHGFFNHQLKRYWYQSFGHLIGEKVQQSSRQMAGKPPSPEDGFVQRYHNLEKPIEVVVAVRQLHSRKEQ